MLQYAQRPDAGNHPTATCHNAPYLGGECAVTERKLPKKTDRYDSESGAPPDIGDEPMSATSTRRAVLAGAAAIPALSLSAVANEKPDALLLALGRQLRNWMGHAKQSSRLGHNAACAF